MDDTNNPILDEDLSSVDTSMPILAADVYDLKIHEAKVAPNNEGTGQVLKLALKTTKDAQSKSGENINAGFPIFHNIGLSPTEKYTKDMIKKNVASFLEAVGAGMTLNPVERLIGRNVRAKVTIQPERDQYPESNRIGRFVKID